MADILRALEYPESQAVEEVSGRQEAGDRAELEAGLLWRGDRCIQWSKCVCVGEGVSGVSCGTHRLSRTFQEGGNVSELRDAVLPVATLLLQLLQAVQELLAGQAGVDAAQLPVHLPPSSTTSGHAAGQSGRLDTFKRRRPFFFFGLTTWTALLLCSPPWAEGPPCPDRGAES